MGKLTGLCQQGSFCFFLGVSRAKGSGAERGLVRGKLLSPSLPCINCHSGSHSEPNQSPWPTCPRLVSCLLPSLH